ncbi:MAG: hypothetical protein AAB400_04425 [Patescibacteria group bacterium]
MLFQNPRRDSAVIALIFFAVLGGVFSLPNAIRFVTAQNARAAHGVVEVQLSPDERTSIEKEIVGIHNGIQRGDGGEGQGLARQYTKLGELYEKLGYLQKAKDAYVKALKQDMRNADTHLHSASVLIRMKDYRGAKKAFEAALDAEPYGWKSYDAYAQFYAATLHNLDEARGMYLKGLVATANHIDLMRAYAAFLESHGMLSEAHEYLQEILNREK